MKKRICGFVAMAFVLALGSPLLADDIHDAIKAGDIARVKALLDKDAKKVVSTRMATDGSTPLHWAAAFDSEAAAELLIKKGADVNAKADNGSTPLHWAANKNTEAVAKLLVDNSADVNAVTVNGFAPLHWAAYRNATAIARLLIDKGANVNAQTLDDFTPLHWAAYNNSIDTAQLLLSRGAIPDARTSRGSTPYELAMAQTNTTLADLIKNAALARERAATNATARSQPPATAAKGADAKGDKKPVQTATAPKASAPVDVKTIPTVVSHVFKDGSAYNGLWVDGTMSGKGVLTFPNGESYDGEWLNGRRQGSGASVYPNGDRYTGQWFNGWKHGLGTYTYANGERYQGQWQNDERSGQGTYAFAKRQSTGRHMGTKPVGGRDRQLHVCKRRFLHRPVA